MALTAVQTVRLLIGDTPTSPFYQLFSDEEIQQFLDLNGQNIMQAARMAAISASMQLAAYSSRERTGDIEVWSNLPTAYLKALENFINDSSSANLPNGLMPYASGISWADFKANNDNPDNIRSPLTKIKLCDAVWLDDTDPFGVCGC